MVAGSSTPIGHATGTPPLLANAFSLRTEEGARLPLLTRLEATVIIQRPGRRRKGVHWLPPPPRGVH